MDNQLDQQAVNLAKAIRQSESGGDFKAVGDNGTSYGAYQFQESTWNATAPKYGVNVPLRQATPEQQNEVAYKQIKEWKDKGLNVGQIASSWNAGAGEPNAYLGTFSNGQPSVKKGKFDVPTYAKSVATAYQTIKSGGSVGVDPSNPSSVGNQANQLPKQANPYGANAPANGNEGLGESISKGLQNIPSSAWNLASSLGNAVLHPIKTAEGIVNAGSGGLMKAENALGLAGAGGNFDNQQTQTFDALIGGLKDRYGSLGALKKTAINDPVGLATDIAMLVSGGGEAIKGLSLAGDAGKIAELTQGMSAVEKAAFISDTAKAGALGTGAEIGQKVADVGNAVNPINIAGKGVGMLAKGAGKVASDTLGIVTGTGGQTIREGFSAALKGEDAYTAFKQGLKGGLSPEDLVNSAKGAVQEVIDNRGASYQEMLKGLKADTTVYNPTPIMDTMRTQLQKFGITESSTGLDFTRSKFALDRAAQGDINTLYEYIKGYGSKDGDLSAVGIDNLKRNISGYWTPNSDYRAMTAALRDSTKGVLENAPGYTKEMRNYAEATDWIDDTKKALSLGDKAMTETSFKKLTTAFKQNNEWRAQALQELDDITGGQLKASIAGQQLSSLMPRGLAKFGAGLEGLSAMHAAISGGAGIVPLLATMVVSSPRLVGEFIKALGITGRGYEAVMNKLGGAVNPATLGATARAQQLTTPTSAFMPMMVNQQNKQQAEQEVSQEPKPTIDKKNLTIKLKSGKIYKFPDQNALNSFIIEAGL